MRRAVALLALLSAALVLVGFGAGFHRAADSMALLRPLAGIACLGFAILFGRGWVGGVTLVAALLAAVTTIPFFLPAEPAGPIAVYSKNLRFDNGDLGAAFADIEATAPDLVLLQEVSEANATLLDDLRAGWPHQQLCRASTLFAVAIASRYPFDGGGVCASSDTAVLARIRHPQGPFWAVSVHHHWLWPYDRKATEPVMLDAIAGVAGPHIVGGDFNAFPWTARVQNIANATGTRLAGTAPVTLWKKAVPLPIDHVLAPGGGTLERRPLVGSDHYGILAKVHLTPQ